MEKTSRDSEAYVQKAITSDSNDVSKTANLCFRLMTPIDETSSLSKAETKGQAKENSRLQKHEDVSSGEVSSPL